MFIKEELCFINIIVNTLNNRQNSKDVPVTLKAKKINKNIESAVLFVSNNDLNL